MIDETLPLEMQRHQQSEVVQAAPVEIIAATKVVNVSRFKKPHTYIGRAGRGRAGHALANPFKIGRDGDRETVVAKFAVWLLGSPERIEIAASLQGHVLGCWCVPALCHGHVVAAVADDIESIRQGRGCRVGGGDDPQTLAREMIWRIAGQRRAKAARKQLADLHAECFANRDESAVIAAVTAQSKLDPVDQGRLSAYHRRKQQNEKLDRVLSGQRSLFGE